ncbi:MarR family transcriptional regulator [Deltaproteobacteria bacterium]|nr:MarR family transcriptional regulator [Deltaproteobacteria bacterium]
MVRQETIDRVIAYVNKMPDIDPEMIRIALSIFHLHREVEMLADTYVAKRYRLSPRQLETLESLFHKQDTTLTPAQLAEEVHLTRSAMTSTLDSLERKGYLSRAAHPDDRRMVIISLTQKGIEFCDKIMPARYQELARVMKGLSSEERDTLHISYNKLLQSIGGMLMEVDK